GGLRSLPTRRSSDLGEELAAMKIALLGTGFGQAHAAVYAPNADYLPARADWIIALSAYRSSFRAQCAATTGCAHAATRKADHRGDRKSTRLNSSHAS